MKEKKPARIDITHTTLSVLFIAILTVASFWVMRPFLLSLIWASVIVVATWPAFEGLQRRLGGRRGLTVMAMAMMILLIILVPVTYAIITIVGNVDNISAQVHSLSTLSLSAPPDWVSKIPVAGGRIAGRWREFAALSAEERTAVALPYARTAMQWFMEQAGSIGMTMVQFFLTMIITMILYANGTVVREGVLTFARRLAGRQGEDAAILAGKAVRGVVLGVVVTALIQAAVGGVGLFLTGIPAAGLLTAVIVFLCLAQVGPFLVMVPAVIWLYWSGQPGRGTVLLVFLVVAGTIDNFVRPFLIRKGADLPLLLIFAGVIGGLIAFGIIGLFIGPVMLAVTYTLLKDWVSGDTPEERAGPDAA
jgi:predicted PurR-regulated permease PerM